MSTARMLRLRRARSARPRSRRSRTACARPTTAGTRGPRSTRTKSSAERARSSRSGRRAERHSFVTVPGTETKVSRGCGGGQLVHLGGELEEDADDGGIELRARAALAFGERFVAAERGPIGPVARHRVVRVRNGQNTGLHRDLLACAPRRVAGAVPTLVVVEDVRECVPERR